MSLGNLDENIYNGNIHNDKYCKTRTKKNGKYA